MRKLEAHVNILKNVNEKLLQRINEKEKQWWASAQYSCRQCLELICIPSSVDDTALEDKVCWVFREIGIKVGERDIKSCHRLKEENFQTIVKFNNRKDLWKNCERSKSFLILNLLRELDNLYNLILEIPNDMFLQLSYALLSN